jgi:ubiquinone/menaquinone biosynthesis C-methylase UbiE
MPAKSENIQTKRRYWEIRAFFYALYFRIPILSTVSKRERRALKKFIIQNLPFTKNLVIVDIGCGGEPFFPVEESSTNLGLDISRNTLKIARKKHLQGYYIQSEYGFLPLKPASINIIMASGLTEYIGDIKLWLVEVKRALSPSGWLIFTTSPPIFCNTLRKMWNPVLFIRKEDFWENLAKDEGFENIACQRIGWQIQYIWRKISHNEGIET